MNEQNNPSDFEVENSSDEPTHCPYCQAEISGIDTIVQCLTCESTYHESCWQELDRCSMYGCEGAESRPVSTFSPPSSLNGAASSTYPAPTAYVDPDFSIDYSELYSTQRAHICIDEHDLGPVLHCSYCHVELQAGELTVACEKCNAMHHHDCWGERNRCAVHGCRHRKFVDNFAMDSSMNGSSRAYGKKNYPAFWDEGWWSSIKKFWNNLVSEW